jgi:hypothetical protein
MADPIPGAPVNPPANVPNYLVPAILTIFCCWPLSIVAIVFAAQVNGKLAGGDYAGAVQSSKQAKMWTWISFGVGLALYLAWFAFTVIVGVIGASAQH